MKEKKRKTKQNKTKEKNKATNPFGEPYEHLVHVIKINPDTIYNIILRII
jgi:hypothetical protein